MDEWQKTAFAVTAIKGVRRRYACMVLRKADVDLTQRVRELTEDEMERMTTIVQNSHQYRVPDWFLNRWDMKDGKYCQSWTMVLTTTSIKTDRD